MRNAPIGTVSKPDRIANFPYHDFAIPVASYGSSTWLLAFRHDIRDQFDFRKRPKLFSLLKGRMTEHSKITPDLCYSYAHTTIGIHHEPAYPERMLSRARLPPSELNCLIDSSIFPGDLIVYHTQVDDLGHYILACSSTSTHHSTSHSSKLSSKTLRSPRPSSQSSYPICTVKVSLPSNESISTFNATTHAVCGDKSGSPISIGSSSLSSPTSLQTSLVKLSSVFGTIN